MKAAFDAVVRVVFGGGILALAALLTACGTTSETTTAPFDLASTTGDASSSTSSGDDDGDEEARARHYVDTQLAWIQRDAAAGEGEHIRTLARLLDEPDAAAFARWTQANHDRLFADLAEPAQLLARLDSLR